MSPSSSNDTYAALSLNDRPGEETHLELVMPSRVDVMLHGEPVDTNGYPTFAVHLVSALTGQPELDKPSKGLYPQSRSIRRSYRTVDDPKQIVYLVSTALREYTPTEQRQRSKAALSRGDQPPLETSELVYKTVECRDHSANDLKHTDPDMLNAVKNAMSWLAIEKKYDESLAESSQSALKRQTSVLISQIADTLQDKYKGESTLTPLVYAVRDEDLYGPLESTFPISHDAKDIFKTLRINPVPMDPSEVINRVKGQTPNSELGETQAHVLLCQRKDSDGKTSIKSALALPWDPESLRNVSVGQRSFFKPDTEGYKSLQDHFERLTNDSQSNLRPVDAASAILTYLMHTTAAAEVPNGVPAVSVLSEAEWEKAIQTGYLQVEPESILTTAVRSALAFFVR